MLMIINARPIISWTRKVTYADKFDGFASVKEQKTLEL